MTYPIFVQQTLHGYADGHQLLASSVALSLEQDSQLLLQSDLSGPEQRRNFESYLTGYPLAQGGYYVFAKTWYASEMPRPGCVWTHSLLIPDEVLARISDLDSLLPLFRRPNEIGELESYSGTLRLDETKGPRSLSVPEDVSQIMDWLYSFPETIVVPARDSEVFESAILAVFAQQWPRLRRSFRFCTGALLPRARKFDLIVVPQDEVMSGMAPASGYRVVGKTQREGLPSETWLAAALRDIEDPSTSTLRNFLWTFGPDYMEGRGVFKLLCELWSLSMHGSLEQAINNSLSALSQAFPAPDASGRLKVALFSPRGAYASRDDGDFHLLRALLTHPGADCLPDQAIDLSARAARVFRRDPARGIELAASILMLRDTPRVAGFLDAVASYVVEMGEIPPAMPIALLEKLVDCRLEVAAMDTTWMRSFDDQLRIFSRVVSHAREQSALLKAIVAAMLAAGSWRLVGQSPRMLGGRAIEAILEWSASSVRNGRLSLPEELTNGVAERADLALGLVERGELSPEATKLVSALVDGRSPEVSRLDPSAWLPAARAKISLGTQAMDLHSYSLLLTVGMYTREPEGAELVAAGFHPVYEASASSSLPDACWEMLEPSLPWYVLTWDRCIRMVRGVLKAFVERDWPLVWFPRTFVSDLSRRQVVREAWSTESRDYLRRLFLAHEEGALPPDSASGVRALRHFVR